MTTQEQEIEEWVRCLTEEWEEWAEESVGLNEDVKMALRMGAEHAARFSSANTELTSILRKSGWVLDDGRFRNAAADHVNRKVKAPKG